jgi:hypothetical protein
MDSRKSTFHAAFGGYQRHARDRKFAFEISEERVHQLFDGDCFYCGASPIPKQVKTRRSSFARNGIDRVNSEIGYLEGNVVSCCEDCNIAKMKRSATDFIDHCRRVTEHQARAAVA